jgi:hypothetical protein
MSRPPRTPNAGSIFVSSEMGFAEGEADAEEDADEDDLEMAEGVMVTSKTVGTKVVNGTRDAPERLVDTVWTELVVRDRNGVVGVALNED